MWHINSNATLNQIYSVVDVQCIQHGPSTSLVDHLAEWLYFVRVWSLSVTSIVIICKLLKCWQMRMTGPGSNYTRSLWGMWTTSRWSWPKVPFCTFCRPDWHASSLQLGIGSLLPRPAHCWRRRGGNLKALILEVCFLVFAVANITAMDTVYIVSVSWYN